MHGPNITTEKEYASEYKSKTGIKLFAVYAALYAGFILVNTFKSSVMETILFAGLNLAVIYGFSLILVAIGMGIVYNYLCTKKEQELKAADPEAEVRS